MRHVAEPETGAVWQQSGLNTTRTNGGRAGGRPGGASKVDWRPKERSTGTASSGSAGRRGKTQSQVISS